MKRIFIIMLAIFICIAMVACSNNEGQTDTTADSESPSKLDQIKENGVLLVGTNANYPPFIFHSQVNGQDEIVGFDKLIADEIAKELGVELEIQDMDFSASLTAVENGMVDMAIGGISATEERMEVMDFSETYYNAEYCVLVRAEDQGKFDTPEKLTEANATVGVQTATIQEDMAREIDGIEIVSIQKTPDLILQLQSGLIDVILQSDSVALLYEASDENLLADGIGNFEGPEVGAGIAVQKGQEDLLEEINKVISNLQDQGKIEEFYDQSIEQAAS